MENVVKKTGLIFYSIFVVTIIIILIGYFCVDELQSLSKETKTSISSVYFLYVVSSIPLTLYFFDKQLKKWRLIEDEQEKLKKYLQGSIIRILLIGNGLLSGTIIPAFLFRSDSMFFCAAICAIFMTFCLPSKNRVLNELYPEEADEEEVTDDNDEESENDDSEK